MENYCIYLPRMSAINDVNRKTIDDILIFFITNHNNHPQNLVKFANKTSTHNSKI